MKVLVIVLLSVLVMSCGDDEESLTVIEPAKPVVEKPEPEATVEPKEIVQHEIPEDIPQELAEHFAGLQEHMTEEEWQLVLTQIDKACNSSGGFFGALERNLSEKALKALEPFRPLLPKERNTVEGRIRVMGEILPNVHYAELERNGAKVVHHKHAYTVIINLDGIVDSRGVGSGAGYSVRSSIGRNRIDDVRVSQVVDKLVDSWSEQWREEFHPRWKEGEFQGKPIELRRSLATEDLRRVRQFFNETFKIPHLPNDLDLFIIYVDEAFDPLNPEEVKGIWYNREDAPQATEKQLAEYNRVHSPDAYDCVGVK